MIDPTKLWFNTPDSHTLCRAGGNGPNHPSQVYAIKKYVKEGSTFLDYGSGSATTLEAIENKLPMLNLQYCGVDIIPKNTDWCRENFPKGRFPNARFEYNPSIHKIDQPDKSFDVVYSRHVVDHMESFEKAMDEHKRVSKDLVIVVLWVPFSNQDEHEIKNIDYRPSGGELFPNEYTNSYSEKKVMEYLEGDPEWELLEVTKDVGSEVSGHDIVIVLKRK